MVDHRPPASVGRDDSVALVRVAATADQAQEVLRLLERSPTLQSTAYLLSLRGIESVDDLPMLQADRLVVLPAEDGLPVRARHAYLGTEQAQMDVVEGRLRLRRRASSDDGHDITTTRVAAVITLASGVAHEFNNINNAIAGFTELALMQEAVPEQVRGYLERILVSTSRAKRTTEALLTFSGLRSGRHWSVCVNDALNEAVELLSLEMNRDEIIIDRDLQARRHVMADRHELVQVFFNLLQNALHSLAGRSERRITIRTRDSDRVVMAEIEDSGCGIPEEILPEVFSPFFSTKGEHAPLGTAYNGIRGTGLGLSVCQTIVERHGGTIHLRSQVGKGTVATVRMPHAEAEERHGTRRLKRVALEVPRHLRIAVVDDEPDTREIMEEYLQAQGYEVFATANGREALQRVDRGEVDLIITDLRMPEYTGEQLLADLLERPVEHRPPAVVVTGREMTDREELSRLGAFSILNKPISLRRLHEAVAEAAVSYEASDDVTG